MSDILNRLSDACVGHPHAQIPWPHRVLHEARDEIVRLRAQVARKERALETARKWFDRALADDHDAANDYMNGDLPDQIGSGWDDAVQVRQALSQAEVGAEREAAAPKLPLDRDRLSALIEKVRDHVITDEEWIERRISEVWGLMTDDSRARISRDEVRRMVIESEERKAEVLRIKRNAGHLMTGVTRHMMGGDGEEVWRTMMEAGAAAGVAEPTMLEIRAGLECVRVAMGVSDDDARQTARYAAQMLAAGYAREEEVWGLAEYLPGSFHLAGASLGLGYDALREKLQHDPPAGAEFLCGLAAQLKRRFGAGGDSR